MDISRTQLDHLGDRLRDAARPTDDDRATFEEYRASFDGAHREVAEHLAAIASTVAESASVTTRRKTLESTIAKLTRIPTRLTQIEDIAGCRVVVDGLTSQDEVVNRALRQFTVLRHRDYRETPQHGYRAVHLVVGDGARSRVEVQIRTESQDTWANMSESIATDHDIEVKYGNGPSAVHAALVQASISMSRYDRFQESPERDDLRQRLIYLLEVGGVAVALSHTVDEAWPEDAKR